MCVPVGDEGDQVRKSISFGSDPCMRDICPASRGDSDDSDVPWESFRPKGRKTRKKGEIKRVARANGLMYVPIPSLPLQETNKGEESLS
jgi:hypothetical protein